MKTRLWSGRRASAAQEEALPETLRVVRDALRGGLSLRQALVRASSVPGSPLAGMRAALDGPRPLARVLYDAARKTPSPELATVLCVLAVQSWTGGDPTRCVAGIEERARVRAAGAREARVLTAQARLSARAMLAITPGFLMLLVALDPRATITSLVSPAGRLAVISGLLLEAAGAVWISRIVSRPGRRSAGLAGLPGDRTVNGLWSHVGRLPVLRAAARLAGGGRTDVVTDDVAQAAEVLALVLDAGLAPARGIAAIAPTVHGPFGDALRDATARMRAGASTAAALTSVLDGLGDQARRFGDAVAGSAALGVPVADTLRALASDLRAASSARLAEEVRRTAVRALVPLGLLVLPAFVLACLVPLFLGGLRGVVP